ncbi:MAG: mechanosensitive ion channel domain-containing protein [Pseudomonadota bacterium]
MDVAEAGFGQWLSPEAWSRFVELGLEYGLNILAVMAILIVGFWVANTASRAVARIGAANDRLDDTLFKFLGSLARYAILAFTIIMVLERFGVETTSIVAIIGAAGLAIGLALQGTLSNLAAGVMLLLFRPFNVGDFIDGADVFGKVEEMNLFTTELDTFDQQRIIIPNSMLWGAKLINHSHHDVRGVDMRFGVAYGANLKVARETIMRVLEAHQYVLSEPAPFVEVETLNSSSVDFLVRPFCDGAHYFDVLYSLPEQVKFAFDEAGVEIPFPHQKVILEKSE